MSSSVCWLVCSLDHLLVYEMPTFRFEGFSLGSGVDTQPPRESALLHVNTKPGEVLFKLFSQAVSEAHLSKQEMARARTSASNSSAGLIKQLNEQVCTANLHPISRYPINELMLFDSVRVCNMSASCVYLRYLSGFTQRALLKEDPPTWAEQIFLSSDRGYFRSDRVSKYAET